jgi:3-hydroxymyristoyl/3-hydroxydecanoyl-(acyl carrier protein) dehydratase
MAFQLLGIMVSKDPELVALLKDKVFVAREAVGAKFGGFILPGDKLTLETQPYISIDEKVGTFLIESSRFSVNVNLKKRGTVAGVVIAAFNPAILSK